MNEFETDNEMEMLIKARQNQPDLYSKLPPATKMSLGIYQDAKAQTARAGLTPDEQLKLRGLKQRIATDILTPGERTAMAIEILNLEKN
jgi:hypothetical protein